MLQPRTGERIRAKQGAKRAATVGLEIERLPAVRAHRMRVEKGGDLLLEEVPLEGAEKLFGLGQAYPEMFDALVIPTTTFDIDTLPFSWYLFLSIHNSTRRQRMLPAYRTADETFAIPQFALTRSDVETFMDELRGFHTAFRACFARQEPRDQFFNYMVGQFSTLERK